MGETPEEAVTEESVLDMIHKTKDYIQSHSEELPTMVYNAMTNLSETILAYKDAQGKEGWAKPTWGQNAPLIEETISNLFEEDPSPPQQGGGFSKKLSLKMPISASFIQKIPSVDPLDISLDKAYYGIRDYIRKIDETHRSIARQLGPIAFVNEMKDPRIPIPYTGITVPISARLILPFINSILESLRLFVATSPFKTDYDNKLLRQILSVVLGLFDISRGEWKDGLLSLLGVYSRNMMIFGFLGKTSRWIYNFISPDIQEDIEDSLYSGGKSMIFGAWLWLFSVVSPDFVRARVNALIQVATEKVENYNEKIDSLEQNAQKMVEGTGTKIVFPRLDSTKIPTFDDIQNLQAIFHHPALYCQPEFQEILQGLLPIPPIRIALELMNIPTLPEKTAEVCRDMPTSLPAAITAELEKNVHVEPEQQGETSTVKEDLSEPPKAQTIQEDEPPAPTKELEKETIQEEPQKQSQEQTQEQVQEEEIVEQPQEPQEKSLLQQKLDEKMGAFKGKLQGKLQGRLNTLKAKATGKLNPLLGKLQSKGLSQFAKTAKLGTAASAASKLGKIGKIGLGALKMFRGRKEEVTPLQFEHL